MRPLGLPQGTQTALFMYFSVYMLPYIKYYFITTNQETIWMTLSTAAATRRLQQSIGGSALARFSKGREVLLYMPCKIG